ncbi:solute:sodium symporter family transporter [Endozoicomonas atrinae]|uniref:solute:sodium symporter family transporter n=1 Tax=Endozoicomonas atrinae TaxID=1333660 RepID=UPI0008251C6E|nr:solute:sodium symporter family transporter [Endozoicomonas atrinae]
MSVNFIQLGVFIFLTAAVGLITYLKCRQQQRSTDSNKDYFLAGGNLTWVYVAGSIMLTNISTEQIVGMNGAQTLLVAWWEIAAAIGLIILAKWLIPLYYQYDCTTTTELLEKRYHDKALRATVSVLFLLGYLFILLPTVLYTGSLFMKSMFGLDLSIMTIAILFAVVGSIYAIFGGLRAIAISDTFNGFGLLIMGLLVTILALYAIDFDLSGIPVERMTLVGGNDSDIPWHTLFTGMIFIQIFYWGTNMVITQRALAAKSVKEAQKGIYAAVVMKLLIPLIVVLPGMIAYKLYGPVGDVAYGRLVGDILPSWLSGAFAAVMAGAVLSTFNSTLNSAAALYVCDIHQNYVNDKACVKSLSMRVSIVFAIIGVALVPVLQNAKSIIALLQQLNGLYSMPVLAAFLVAILFDQVKPRAILISMLMGSGLYAIFTFAWTPLHYIHLMCITLVATMACSLLINQLVYGQKAQLRMTGKADKLNGVTVS